MRTYFVTVLCMISTVLSLQAAEKPNIVIVLTDDLGYGDVSFLNAESKVKTPHMDALAKAGVWATDAHSPSTVCSPSRYAMLTGRYSWRTKIGRLNPWKESAIENDRVTLPKILQSRAISRRVSASGISALTGHGKAAQNRLRRLSAKEPARRPVICLTGPNPFRVGRWALDLTTISAMMYPTCHLTRSSKMTA